MSKSVKRHTLVPIIEANIEKGSTIHSDELRTYDKLDQQGYTHETVNHGRGEYVRNGAHVNSMEGYWSRLKLSIRGTHVHVSPKYLENYAKEFEYRFNSRKCPQMMLPELLAGF